ncbi:MAG TPA: response regulator [Candidatus Hydrogenedentes bacterium]|nr:response regulator [Candidatus Hydrogenedentota bacterium]HIJ72521.1 response regulator [Candidatus Hydrogenedentota bacterium]
MARILLADDDAASLEVMVLALESEGHEVVQASNGQEAYEYTLSYRPDLVFLDVMMPIFDGYETCEMIRNDPEVSETLPIIFLTSVEVDKKKLEKVGASDFLPKRHVITQLRDLLVEHLGPKANAR